MGLVLYLSTNLLQKNTNPRPGVLYPHYSTDAAGGSMIHWGKWNWSYPSSRFLVLYSIWIQDKWTWSGLLGVETV